MAPSRLPITKTPKVYVGGAFSALGGQPRNHLARLSTANGAVDPWNPDLDSGVHRIRLSADQTKVFIAGSRQITRLPPEVKTRVDTMIEKAMVQPNGLMNRLA